MVGGGPAGLYFAILMKKAEPGHEVRVVERNRPDDTFGFGVVFSDATIAEIEAADPETYRLITERFVHWDEVDVHYRGEVLRSTGHGFAGMSRHRLLEVLQERARDLGVEIEFGREVTDLAPFGDADLLVGADGVNSTVRGRLEAAGHVETEIDRRPNRYVWLGTTKPFPAFTFYFKEDEHGLWRVHAYRYEEGSSTFIVEAREETWRRAGMDDVTEEETIAFLEALFEEELDGHELIGNRSVWRQFETVRAEPWSVGETVLIGDAAHTAHFSVGSGTRMAMMDAIALSDALAEHPDDRRAALERYEEERRPDVESLQRAAQASLRWFEDTERYMDLHPLQFAYTLLTRSLRITHQDLRVRDPDFLERVTRWFAGRAEAQSGRPVPRSPAPPPMFTPFRVRDMVLENRVVVSPMCQYTAEDGTVGEWHVVHLGSRAVGGAGLVMAEMTDVSREGRISTGCAGLYKDEHADAWARVVDFVHENSYAKIGIQLGHAGRKGATKFLWEGGETEPLPEEERWPLMAPSPKPYVPTGAPPRGR